MSEQLRGRWAGQRIPFGEAKPVPGAPCSNVCREGKEGRRQMLARPASDVRQLGGLAYAPVCYVVSMYRKLLDQAVEFPLEHTANTKGRSDPGVPDRIWVRCRLLGEHRQVK